MQVKNSKQKRAAVNFITARAFRRGLAAAEAVVPDPDGNRAQRRKAAKGMREK